MAASAKDAVAVKLTTTDVEYGEPVERLACSIRVKGYVLYTNADPVFLKVESPDE